MNFFEYRQDTWVNLDLIIQAAYDYYDDGGPDGPTDRLTLFVSDAENMITINDSKVIEDIANAIGIRNPISGRSSAGPSQGSPFP